MTVLPDGVYDAFVIDAEPVAGPDAGLRLELTVIAGAHKGEVVAVTATGLDREALDVVGLPATLVVDDGAPAVTIDD
jgi:hypothetical protein